MEEAKPAAHRPVSVAFNYIVHIIHTVQYVYMCIDDLSWHFLLLSPTVLNQMLSNLHWLHSECYTPLWRHENMCTVLHEGNQFRRKADGYLILGKSATFPPGVKTPAISFVSASKQQRRKSRLYDSTIHWQANESRSPKLFMWHKGCVY